MQNTAAETLHFVTFYTFLHVRVSDRKRAHQYVKEEWEVRNINQTHSQTITVDGR